MMDNNEIIDGDASREFLVYKKEDIETYIDMLNRIKGEYPDLEKDPPIDINES